ncbi:MAG: ribonuclease HII [Bacteroidota bacterium]|nr:ribonuclease HII [Bacteroidota bacterium]
MLKPFLNPNLIEVGCDEAGRGCLAGPVFAAAVILPKGVVIEGLHDSKQLTEHKRMALREEIEAKCHWAVVAINEKEIDKINILNASIKGMMSALDKLKVPFYHILVDGNRFKPYRDIPYTTIVKGDGKYQSIAAASILAKTHRDDYMKKIAEEFPDYGWEQNKGYPTLKHRDAIRKIGPCQYHRMSFTLLPEQLKLEF